MRILQLCNKPPFPPRDGGSMAMFNLASALCRTGHSVTVLTMVTRKHRLTYEQHQRYNDMMEVFTVHVEAAFSWAGFLYNLLFSKKPYTASRFISATFEIRLAELLSAQHFDVIQLEGLYLAPYIETIRKNTKGLISLRAHNVEHEIWERNAKEENSLLKKKYFESLSVRVRQFETGILNKYDLLVPITLRDLEKLNNMGNKKPSHVCPGGIDTVEESDASLVLPDTFSLYFLGSLDWIPNQEGVLWFISYVFPSLRERYPDIRLHVAGRNAPNSFIRKIDFPGIAFHGEIEDARSFSSSHSIMIAPTFSGSGMRLKILEAMSLGKAVVTTNIGAEGLMVSNNEHLITANDAFHFQSAIERLINNPEICLALGRNAMKLVKEEYNNNSIAESLATFYQQHLE